MSFCFPDSDLNLSFPKLGPLTGKERIKSININNYDDVIKQQKITIYNGPQSLPPLIDEKRFPVAITKHILTINQSGEIEILEINHTPTIKAKQ